MKKGHFKGFGKSYRGKNDDAKLFSIYLVILAVKSLFLFKWHRTWDCYKSRLLVISGELSLRFFL